MKATAEMSYPLVKSAKEVAQQSKATQQALKEDGLSRVVHDSQAQAKSAFKLQNASVGGKVVLKPAPADWQQLEKQHVCDRVLARKARR